MENAEEIVAEIERDRRRGATALAVRALDAMGRSAAVAARLIRARPSMPVIAAVVRLARRKGVAEARKELARRNARLLERVPEYLPEGARYVVHGRSSTIESALKVLRAKRVRELPADMALLGADALYPDWSFVNAKGSREFAVRARRSGSAVFVVASDLKRVRREVPLERGFERVPAHVVHAVITESGIHYPEWGPPAPQDPHWLDRGPVDVRASMSWCHPQHGRAD